MTLVAKPNPRGPEYCAGLVWAGRIGHVPCPNRGKVERDGFAFCGVHDPERVKAKEAERKERLRQESEASDRKWARSQNLADLIGYGRPYYAGGVLLSEQAARELLKAWKGIDVPEAGE